MSANERAREIAEAAEEAMGKDPSIIEAALVGASSDDIVRAIDYVLKRNMPERARIMLANRLEVKLTKEHVEAQRAIAAAEHKLARRIKCLNSMLVVLTILLVFLALPDALAKVRDCVTEWRAGSAWQAWTIQQEPERPDEHGV